MVTNPDDKWDELAQYDVIQQDAQGNPLDKYLPEEFDNLLRDRSTKPLSQGFLDALKDSTQYQEGLLKGGKLMEEISKTRERLLKLEEARVKELEEQERQLKELREQAKVRRAEIKQLKSDIERLRK